MIRIKTNRAEDIIDIIQYASLAGIERERTIGWVLEVYDEQRYEVYPPPNCGLRAIAFTESLPAAIQALIVLHKMTDYQYAPWPAMEEDEE